MCPRPGGQLGQPLVFQMGSVFHSPCLWPLPSSGWFRAPLSVQRTSKGSSPQDSSQHPSFWARKGHVRNSEGRCHRDLYGVGEEKPWPEAGSWMRRPPGTLTAGKRKELPDPTWLLRAALCHDHHKRAPLHQKRQLPKKSFPRATEPRKAFFHFLLLV